MFIISAREKFNNPDRLKNSGHVYKEIDLERDEVINSFETQDDFLAKIKDKKVLILVHGFNNEQDEVYDAYSIIEQKVNAQVDDYDHVIGYSWPGGDRGIEWYSSKRRANAVARRFRFLLDNLAQHAEFVDVMSHSLGARVVFKALKESENKTVRNYFCTAPAVDNEVLEKGEEFSASLTSIGSLFVFHSKKDGVLSSVYRAAEWDNALGLYGPEDKSYIQHKTKNVFVVNCKHVVSRHGGYKKADEMYRFITSSLVKKPAKFKTL